MKYIQNLVLVFVLLATVQAAKKKTAQTGVLFTEFGGFPAKAAFYDEEYLGGSSTSIETEGPCKNLPERWIRKPLSMDTHGTCALVCTELECEGDCVKIYPAHGEQQLSKVGMAKKISSMKHCFK